MSDLEVKLTDVRGVQPQGQVSQKQDTQQQQTTVVPVGQKEATDSGKGVTIEKSSDDKTTPEAQKKANLQAQYDIYRTALEAFRKSGTPEQQAKAAADLYNFLKANEGFVPKLTRDQLQDDYLVLNDQMNKARQSGDAAKIKKAEDDIAAFQKNYPDFKPTRQELETHDKVAELKDRAADGERYNDVTLTSYQDSRGKTGFTADKSVDRKADSQTNNNWQKKSRKDMREKYGKYTYVDENGVEHTITDKAELKKLKKDAKKDVKQTRKDIKQHVKDIRDLQVKANRGDAAAKEQLQAKTKELEDLNAHYIAAKDVKDQASAAYDGARGKGARTLARLDNRTMETNKRLTEREVYTTEEAAKKAGKSGDNVRIISDDDIRVLTALKARAQAHIAEDSSPENRAKWEELSKMNIDPDKDGKYDVVSIQDALIDLGGTTMDYSERATIAKETGMSKSDVRHMLRTFGFRAPAAAGTRVKNFFLGALPGIAAMGSTLLSHSKAAASATAERSGHAESTVTETTPGQTIRVGDKVKVIAGTSATATAAVDLTVKATAEAVAKAAGNILAPALITTVMGIINAAKKPNETSAGDSKKMADFVSAYTGSKNQQIGAQIIQLEGRITGNKEFDRELVRAVLERNKGSQNDIMTREEIKTSLDELLDIRKQIQEYQHQHPQYVEPAAPQQPQQPQETPAPAQQQEQQQDEGDCFQPVVEKPFTHKVGRFENLTYIARAFYPGADVNKAIAAIADANGIKHKDSIAENQELTLPAEIDGVARKDDAKPHRNRGTRRISYRPTRRLINGKPTWAVERCDTHEIVGSGYPTEDAAQDASNDFYAQSKKK